MISLKYHRDYFVQWQMQTVSKNLHGKILQMFANQFRFVAKLMCFIITQQSCFVCALIKTLLESEK